MLTDKLLSATAAAAAAIEYVGGYAVGYVGTNSPKTITFGGNLTGGIASSASEGDLVIFSWCTGSSLNRTMTAPDGWTRVADLYSNDTYDTNLAVAFKRMGSSPDTDVVLPSGTFSTTDAGAATIQVFRNAMPFVDGIYAATATGNNAGRPTPPTRTPTDTGSYVVCVGAGALTGTPTAFTNANLTNFLVAEGTDSYGAQIGAGYHEWVSGTFTPGQFGLISTTTSASWAAASLILLPSSLSLPEFINSSNVYTTSSTVTLAIPADTADGDLMLAFLGTRTVSGLQNWSGPGGWTEVVDAAGDSEVQFAVYWKVAASESGSYDFTIANLSTPNAGSLVTIRNATYGTTGTVAKAYDTTVGLPGVTADLVFGLGVARDGVPATSIGTYTAIFNNTTNFGFIVTAGYPRGASGDLTLTGAALSLMGGVLIGID